MSIREDIRKELEGLTQDELIHVLRESGFNVSKGTGKITIEGENDEHIRGSKATF